jgi:hypothetical protein
MKATQIIVYVIYFIGSMNKMCAQALYIDCNLSIVLSKNEKYYLTTIPFDKILQTSIGKTTVYKSDSTKVYELDRNFDLVRNHRDLFLSNDGRTIVFVSNYEFEWEGKLNKSIIIYRDGVLVKEYQLNELIECDDKNENCYLYYRKAIERVDRKSDTAKIIYKESATDFEKYVTQRSTYLNNDTLFIFTNDAKVITIDVNTLKLTTFPNSYFSPSTFYSITPVKVRSVFFNTENLSKTPLLQNSQTLKQTIADSLGMSVFPEDQKSEALYKKHRISLEIILDKEGTANVSKLESKDNLDLKKVERILKSNKFETKTIPTVTDKWVFQEEILLMTKDTVKAIKEKKMEIAKDYEDYLNRLNADSIDGIYIPQNIEECFLELNKLLKNKDILEIKNLNRKDQIIQFHHGLGTWLRNNWGLWGGSRLQTYLVLRGTNHPESMSSVILEFYHDWLNDKHDAWKAFDQTLK